MQVHGSTLPIAVSKATKVFWRELNRKQRFDAATSLRVDAREVKEATTWQE
jgi:hypothetical protein